MQSRAAGGTSEGTAAVFLRPRILRALSVARDVSRIVVVSAPPGYGKSALLHSIASVERTIRLAAGDGLDALLLQAGILEAPRSTARALRLIAESLRDSSTILVHVSRPTIAISRILGELASNLPGQVIFGYDRIDGVEALQSAIQTPVARLGADVLRVTKEDLITLGVEPAVATDLVAETLGWPLAIATLIRAGIPDVKNVPPQVSAELKRAVCEVILPVLDPEELAVLRWSAYIGVLSPRLLDALGVVQADPVLDRLSINGLLVERLRGDDYVVAAPVRSAMIDEERLRGHRCVERAARALTEAGEATGDYAAMLDAAQFTGEPVYLASILRKHGRALCDRGLSRRVAAAFARLPAKELEEPWALLLRAHVESDPGKLEHVESLLKKAVANAVGPLAVLAASQLATHLNNCERHAEALGVLGDARLTGGDDVRALFASARAIAHSAVGNHELATEDRHSAIASALATNDHIVIARVYQRAALSASRSGDMAEARDHVERALINARKTRLPGIEAPALTIAYYLDALAGDADAEMRSAQRLKEFAALNGERQCAIMGAAALAALHANRGDFEETERQRRFLQQTDVHRSYASDFGITYALALADVAATRQSLAINRLSRFARETRDPYGRAAATAMSLALQSRSAPPEYSREVRKLRAHLAKLCESKMEPSVAQRLAYAVFFLGLAEIGAGQHREARRTAGRLRRIARTPRDRILAEAADALAGTSKTAAAATDRLKSQGLAGIARFLDSCLVPTHDDEIALTAAERRVLEILTRNTTGTSKEQAEEIGIRVSTFNTHLDRLSKKLNVSGKHSIREAATARGLITG